MANIEANFEKNYVNGEHAGHVNFENTSDESDFNDESYYCVSSFCEVEVENDENEISYNTNQSSVLPFTSISIRNNTYTSKKESKKKKMKEESDKEIKFDPHLSLTDQYRNNFCQFDRHFLKGDSRPYQCLECPKSFANANSLAMHTRRHSGSLPYKCSWCDKHFRQVSELKSHLPRHTGEKPFKCSYCDKSCATSSHLKVHTRKHTGERPYVCIVCSKGYCQKSELSSHMKSHDKDKKFHCERCRQVFKNSNQLTVHVKQCTTDITEVIANAAMQMRCELCGAVFNHILGLITHKNTAHA